MSESEPDPEGLPKVGLQTSAGTSIALGVWRTLGMLSGLALTLVFARGTTSGEFVSSQVAIAGASTLATIGNVGMSTWLTRAVAIKVAERDYRSIAEAAGRTFSTRLAVQAAAITIVVSIGISRQDALPWLFAAASYSISLTYRDQVFAVMRGLRGVLPSLTLGPAFRIMEVFVAAAGLWATGSALIAVFALAAVSLLATGTAGAMWLSAEERRCLSVSGRVDIRFWITSVRDTAAQFLSGLLPRLAVLSIPLAAQILSLTEIQTEVVVAGLRAMEATFGFLVALMVMDTYVGIASNQEDTIAKRIGLGRGLAWTCVGVGVSVVGAAIIVGPTRASSSGALLLVAGFGALLGPWISVSDRLHRQHARQERTDLAGWGLLAGGTIATVLPYALAALL